MSKKVKSLIEKELNTKFSPLDGVAVISPKGIDGTKTNLLRRKLLEKGLKMTVVKNTLARRAAASTKLKGFEVLLDGPSAVIYGKASVATIARLLIDEKKEDERIELRGVFFDGEVYAGREGRGASEQAADARGGDCTDRRSDPWAGAEIGGGGQGPEREDRRDSEEHRGESGKIGGAGSGGRELKCCSSRLAVIDVLYGLNLFIVRGALMRDANRHVFEATLRPGVNCHGRSI